MFTGIVTATTPILKSRPTADGLRLIIKTPTDWTDIQVGESISTNGVCLTIAAIRSNEYEVFLIPETLARTAFGIVIPKRVNLERAMRLHDRLSGHFVQGHIDTTATVSRIDSSNGYVVELNYPKKYQPLITTKGSIAIDGVALTVVAYNSNTLSVALVPHTLLHTTLGDLKQNDIVNLEFDMLGKYVSNFMELKVK